jgi:hypothetical protein
VKLVNPIQILGLTEQQQVGIATRADERERAQQMAVGEILAGSDEFPLVTGSLLGIKPSPCRIDLQEGVLNEMPSGH